MKIHAIASPQNAGQSVRLGEGMPELLALGYGGEVLPVFGPESALREFARAHPSLQTNGPESVEPVLLGSTFFEVAETISQVVEAGQLEKVIFDPVLDSEGVWVCESLNWPAKDFCEEMFTIRPVVMDIARRKEGVPADRPPSSEAVDEAHIWYMWRLLAYVHGPSRVIEEVRQTFGQKD